MDIGNLLKLCKELPKPPQEYVIYACPTLKEKLMNMFEETSHPLIGYPEIVWTKHLGVGVLKMFPKSKPFTFRQLELFDPKDLHEDDS